MSQGTIVIGGGSLLRFSDCQVEGWEFVLLCISWSLGTQVSPVAFIVMDINMDVGWLSLVDALLFYFCFASCF